MKLASIANQVLINIIAESVEGESAAIQQQMKSLGAELKKDGEDVSDEEVQAAILSALVDANGDMSQVHADDVEAMKKEIKESKGYSLNESELLHGIEAIGTILGNSAFVHSLAGSLEKVLNKKVDEEKLKKKLLTVSNSIKSVTGLPAKAMEKAFTWIAKKLGGSEFTQKVAGMSGTLVLVAAMLTVAIMLFPSLSSGILMILSITSMVGKGTEIIKIIKEIIEHIKEEMHSNPGMATA